MIEWVFMYSIEIGVDEAGRGALAGPVTAAAVVINGENLKDSKQLSEKRREELAIKIKTNALVYGIQSIDPWKIDEVNIMLLY